VWHAILFFSDIVVIFTRDLKKEPATSESSCSQYSSKQKLP